MPMDASTASLITEDVSPTTKVRRHPDERRAPRIATRAAVQIAIAGAVLLGILVRASLVLSRDFPLNDGGLFYQMTQDLQAAHFHLPAFTTYNSAHIPFGYSPLAFYLAGALASVFHVSLVQVFRLVPLVATCLTLVAFVRLARRLLVSDAVVIAAVVAFALLPRSYVWLIMGGGITRAPGFLFAILALNELHALYTRRQTWRVGLVALFAACTVLSHLGTAPFLAASALLFFAAFGRSRYGVVVSAVAALGAVVVTAPWWVDIILVHGSEPFLAARAAGNSILSQPTRGQILNALAHFGFGTSEPILPIIGMLAVVGAVSSLAARRWLLPAWWVLIVVLDARAGATYATVPVAMLAGIAIVEVLAPWARVGRTRRLRSRMGLAGDAAPAPSANSGHGPLAPVAHRHAPPVEVGSAFSELPLVAPLALLLCFSLGSAVSRNRDYSGELRDLQSLSPDERSAMRWAASTMPPSSRVLIVSGLPWEVDRSSEWFPVLAHRVSVATVQGSEWLALGEFAHRQHAFNDVQGCANWFAGCLGDWARRNNLPFTHVYIPKPGGDQCCRVLLESLRHHASYALVYESSGAVIFAVRPHATPQ